MFKREGEWECVKRETVHEREGSGSQWRERQCVTTVTTNPPSPFLYLHTVSSIHSQSPSLSLSEWSGRQCASTGREREGEWERTRRLHKYSKREGG